MSRRKCSVFVVAAIVAMLGLAFASSAKASDSFFDVYTEIGQRAADGPMPYTKAECEIPEDLLVFFIICTGRADFTAEELEEFILDLELGLD